MNHLVRVALSACAVFIRKWVYQVAGRLPVRAPPTTTLALRSTYCFVISTALYCLCKYMKNGTAVSIACRPNQGAPHGILRRRGRCTRRPLIRSEIHPVRRSSRRSNSWLLKNLSGNHQERTGAMLRIANAITDSANEINMNSGDQLRSEFSSETNNNEVNNDVPVRGDSDQIEANEPGPSVQNSEPNNRESFIYKQSKLSKFHMEQRRTRSGKIYNNL